MTNCLQCGKELTHVEGRKKKHFCDNNCKNKHFYAERQKLIKAALAAKPSGVHITVEQLEEVVIEEVQTNPPTIIDGEEINLQIAAIRAEKIPAHRDTPMGRKVWQQEQQKRISELLNKLK